MKKHLFIVFIIASIFFSNKPAHATEVDIYESKNVRGTIQEVLSDSEKVKYIVKLETGDIITVEYDKEFNAKLTGYEEGQKILLAKLLVGNNYEYTIIDHWRINSLIILFAVFITFAVVVAKKRGVASLISMVFTFFIIFTVILPAISQGKNAVGVIILSSLYIIPTTFYLSHGFNKKTHIAVVATLFTLIITSFLAALFVSLTKLTGYASEEAMFLKATQDVLDIKNIMLAGIIIGLLGILDDITVTQSGFVAQIKSTDPNLGTLDLYNKGMELGKDHISSLINTLILVYTGASMPLLLLFVNNPQPVVETFNMEIIADNIVRTLIGSIGLIVAVPITTFLASILQD